MNTDKKSTWILCACGLIPVVWLALLAAPHLDAGIMGLLQNLTAAINNPLSLTWTKDSLRAVLLFVGAYGLGIGIFLSTRRKTRRGMEHGSAQWGNPHTICRKYRNQSFAANKIMTKHVRVGLDGRVHRRNLNTMVIGGSGAGKTRFYAKVNIMQANTSFVCLDPKGESLRDTGYLLEQRGYEIRVLDLINMERSHCYNPFIYLQDDNDVQRLVTNLFKSTTPKGSKSSDPFSPRLT